MDKTNDSIGLPIIVIAGVIAVIYLFNKKNKAQPL